MAAMNQVQVEQDHIGLLRAAIQHLQMMYLNSPNRCLSSLINRNYGLLLEQNMASTERDKWLDQKKTWQQYCEKPVNNKE